MGGRHRPRRRERRVRRLLAGVVPVIGAAGLTVAVVLGGGALATPPLESVPAAAPAAPTTPIAAGSGAGRMPAWLREATAPGPLAGVVGNAADAARDRHAQRVQGERDARQQARSDAGVCDLDGPPRFDDPAHPNEITNRDCGYVDGQGRERSRDPWIDGQLLSSYGE